MTNDKRMAEKSPRKCVAPMAIGEESPELFLVVNTNDRRVGVPL
jgi:hypothetical protein